MRMAVEQMLTNGINGAPGREQRRTNREIAAEEEMRFVRVGNESQYYSLLMLEGRSD